MAPSRSKATSKGRKSKFAPELPPKPYEENSEDSAEEIDDEEEALDRLVLGDETGFMAQLGTDMALDEEDASEDEEGVPGEDEEGEGGIEDIDDADVRASLGTQR